MVEHQTIKAGFHLNRNEIWSRFKRELLRLERVWNTFRQLTPSKESPRLVGDCLVSVLILYFKFQFSKSSKPSTIHIFLNLAYPFRRKICLSQNAQKSPKNLHKTAKHWSMKYAEDLALLETWLRYWQKVRFKRLQNSLTRSRKVNVKWIFPPIDILTTEKRNTHCQDTQQKG